MTLAPGYRISLDPGQLQLDVIHGFLTACYWSPGIPRDTVAKAIGHSVCVGAYTEAGEQVGFARLVTDQATFAYLADVFVLEAHRGRGLSRAMVQALLDLPDAQGLRRILLLTRDAHGVYEKLGFERITDPAPFMHIHRKDVYRKA
jgi:GNAT superfamily N-acetyltransferase